MKAYGRIMQHIQQTAISRFAGSFGLPNIVTLLIVRRYVSDGEMRSEWLEIPNLILESLDPSQFATLFDVDARKDEFVLKGIPRDIDDIHWLQGVGCSYFIDAKVIDSKIEGGYEAEFITINDDNPLVFNLTLRKKPDVRRA